MQTTFVRLLMQHAAKRPQATAMREKEYGIWRALSWADLATLVEQLAQSPDKLVLGGEERTMTIMFSDVRGFTALSETFKDDPQGLTQLMNRLLTPLSNAILEKNGTIDKYMGIRPMPAKLRWKCLTV